MPTPLPEPSPTSPPGPLARVLAFVARHHVTLLLALGALMNVWAILSVRWFPAQDMGGHIELMDIMARADDPATIYPEMYQTTSPITANGLSLILASLFGGILSAVTIAKLMLLFYAAALPFSVAAVARAFDRPAWLALFACPLTFSTALALGFINFVVAMPMLFWSVALARRYAEGGGWRLGVVLTALMTTTFLAHIIAFMITLGLVTFVIWLHLPSLRRATRLVPVVASTPLFLVWVYERIFANVANSSGRTFVGANEGLGSVFLPLDVRFDTLRANVFRFLPNSTDEIVLILLVLAWLFLLAYAMRASASASPEPAAPAATGVRAWLRGYVVELIVAGCLVAYFTLPNNVREVDIIAERAWYIGVFFVALMPRVRASRGVAWIVAALSLVSVAYPVAVQRMAARFDQDLVGGLPEALASLPDKTSLAYFGSVREPEGYYHGVQWHLAKAIHSTENGGYTNDNFAIRPYFPIDFKPGMAPGPLESRFWNDPNLFAWDHVILFQPNEPSGALRSKRVKLRWHEGAWWLFDVNVPEGWRTDMSGGHGGVEHLDACPDERAPTGLELTYDPGAVTSVRLLCGDAHTKRRGDEVGAKERLACPGGTGVVALYGRADHFVRALGVRCSGSDGAVVELAAVGAPGGAPFDRTCSGAALRGLKTRSGAAIDAVGLSCSNDPKRPTPNEGEPPGE